MSSFCLTCSSYKKDNEFYKTHPKECKDCKKRILKEKYKNNENLRTYSKNKSMTQYYGLNIMIKNNKRTQQDTICRR